MATDSPESLPSPSPPPPSPSSFSSLSHFRPTRHYCVVVDCLRFKMDTLVDLLGVARRSPFLPIMVCCSSRDELDVVCSFVSGLSFISFSPLYRRKFDKEEKARHQEGPPHKKQIKAHLSMEGSTQRNLEEKVKSLMRKQKRKIMAKKRRVWLPPGIGAPTGGGGVAQGRPS